MSCRRIGDDDPHAVDGSDLRQVTEVNKDASDYDFGRTEALRWDSTEGVSIEGLVTYPADYQRGRRYPVVLVAHGGPEGVFSASFVGSSSVYGQVATLASLG
jgi:dipeptidyl aminopeptidase/acylaminoacyl peptidase